MDPAPLSGAVLDGKNNPTARTVSARGRNLVKPVNNF
jgi:hypothetical protein